MSKRTSTVALDADRRSALRTAGRRAGCAGDRGETLGLETAGALFGRLESGGAVRPFESVHIDTKLLAPERAAA